MPPPPSDPGVPLLGLALAVGAGLAFTAFDAARKRVAAHVHPLALVAWLQIAGLPFLVGWCVLEGVRISTAWIGPGLVALVAQATGNAAFIGALARAPLGQAVPFLALTPALSAGAAWVLLGEEPAPRGLLGMAAVTVGAFALALARAPSTEAGAAPFRLRPGSLLAIGAAVAWSLGATLDKAALAHASPSVHAALLSLGALVSFGIERRLRAGPRALALPVAARPGLLVAGLLGSAALGLQLAAYGALMVSTVEATKRAIGGIAALALGWALFGEVPTRRAALAVGLMTVGAVLVLEP